MSAEVKQDAQVIRSKFLSGNLTLLPESSFGEVYFPLLQHLIKQTQDLLSSDVFHSKGENNNPDTLCTPDETIALLNLLFIVMSKCKLQLSLPSKLNISLDNCHDNSQDVYSAVIPLITAVIFKLPTEFFPHIEDLLLKNLLSSDPIRVMVSSDIWCCVVRANQASLLRHICFLNSIPKEQVTQLWSRMMAFCEDGDKEIILERLGPLDKVAVIDHINEVDRIRTLKTLIEVIFSDANCVLNNVVAASHFMASLSSETLHRELGKDIVDNMWQFLLFQISKNGKSSIEAVKECLVVISVLITPKEILTAMIGNFQVYPDLILNIVHKNRERISKETCQVSKEILLYSVLTVNVKSDEDVIKFCDFAYSFQINQPNVNVVDLINEETLKEIFQIYCEEEEIVDEPTRTSLLYSIMASVPVEDPIIHVKERIINEVRPIKVAMETPAHKSSDVGESVGGSQQRSNEENLIELGIEDGREPVDGDGIGMDEDLNLSS
jgi:hypothetical protein